MHQVICYISILATSLVLAACGQSGALHLPNDPDYDKRAKYLLYKNTEAESKASDEERDASVQQQFAAPEASDSTTTP
ncbi:MULTISPECIES: LPS translocon maturation chaperone LptM [Acinetobacter]|uniref:LPS translocon maturation chaperone LptM n=1 Tax=Acinetobacter TaxID=469 RepID=UPI0015D1B3B0|nr:MULTISPECIES: lipoprotein [Acinetobacter]MDH5819726.1 lipoprotein [Acinetobacter pseudolwoffii]